MDSTSFPRGCRIGFKGFKWIVNQCVDVKSVGRDVGQAGVDPLTDRIIGVKPDTVIGNANPFSVILVGQSPGNEGPLAF
jgi:hypothetical protein